MSEQYRLSMEAALDQWKKAASQQGEKIITLQSDLQALRDERDRLRAALQAFCDEVEMDAAVMAYKCDLGAGEWEAFIDRTKLYKQYLAGKAALTPAGGQERANDSHIG